MSPIEIYPVLLETAVLVIVVGYLYGKQIYKAIEDSLNN